MPRILVLEHGSEAPAALFASWLAEAGAELVVSRPWAGDEVPPLEGCDAWLVLGGSMGAHDDDRAPWLPEVKARIAEAADKRVPLLGICLGHQLAAVATGGRVVRNPAGQRVGLCEIGWTAAAADDPLVGRLGEAPRAVQWNNDVVVELGPGAELLAASPEGEVQAARFAPSVWGVQWHPEVDRSVVQVWADAQCEAHLHRGIDVAAALTEIEGAAAELEAAWRPLAVAFAHRAGGEE